MHNEIIPSLSEQEFSGGCRIKASKQIWTAPIATDLTLIPWYVSGYFSFSPGQDCFSPSLNILNLIYSALNTSFLSELA